MCRCDCCLQRFGVLVVGVLATRAFNLGSSLGPLIFRNSHVVVASNTHRGSSNPQSAPKNPQSASRITNIVGPYS